MPNEKRSKSPGSRRQGRGIVLPADACPSCGTMLKEKNSTLSLPVNGEDIRVKNSPHLSCPKCREKVLNAEHARHLQRAAVDAYRKKYKLLSAEEIHALRERFRLTQAELAKILRLGPNTISRWESGRNAQTAAMDVLLRLIRDIPESIEYLQKNVA